MNIALFILSSLAVWRITHMFLEEAGPFNIFGKIEQKLYKMKHKDGGIRNLLTCFYCLSIYISLPFSIYLSKNIFEFIVFTLSLSTISIFIESLMDKNKTDREKYGR